MELVQKFHVQLSDNSTFQQVSFLCFQNRRHRCDRHSFKMPEPSKFDPNSHTFDGRGGVWWWWVERKNSGSAHVSVFDVLHSILSPAPLCSLPSQSTVISFDMCRGFCLCVCYCVGAGTCVDICPGRGTGVCAGVCGSTCAYLRMCVYTYIHILLSVCISVCICV